MGLKPSPRMMMILDFNKFVASNKSIADYHTRCVLLVNLPELRRCIEVFEDFLAFPPRSSTAEELEQCRTRLVECRAAVDSATDWLNRHPY